MKAGYGIIGTGSFASALARVTRAPALLYGTAAPRGDAGGQARFTPDPAELCREARFLVLAVRGKHVADALEPLGAHLLGDHFVVHASGALLPEGTVSQVIKERTAVKRVGVLAGPALARDLEQDNPSALVIASAFDDVMLAGQKLLAAPPVLRVYRRRDLQGVELAAALSGVMTIAVGLVDGLELGAGPRALGITRAVAEMARFGNAAGAGEAAFSGLAGLGNVLVRSQTGSEHAEDYQLGLALARGDRSGSSEGADTARVAQTLGRRLGVRTPILDGVVALVDGKATATDVLSRLTEMQALEE